MSVESPITWFRKLVPVRVENRDLTPSIVIRPHHFWMPYTQKALLGTVEPDALASFRVMQLLEEDQVTDPAYIKDLIGEESSNTQRYSEGLTTYYSQLRDLPDESFVQLDIQPDGLCKACVIGRHCNTTNYASYAIFSYFIANISDAENLNLKRIRDKLKRGGYRKGVDFTDRPTTHTLYDFKGRDLGDSAEGVPQDVTFNSLIVRVGVLRDIARISLRSSTSIFFY